MKILLVCLGNICRSPLAEGILQQKAAQAELNWVIESAGTNGFHTGEPPHHLSQKVAKAAGIDISQQLSRKFTKEDFEKYDRIYAMAADVLADMKKIGGTAYNAEKTRLFMEESHPGRKLDVPDPWYGDEDGYISVFKLISDTCDALIRNHFEQNKKNAINI
jgi:protein-tyrosine phosphatase